MSFMCRGKEEDSVRGGPAGIFPSQKTESWGPLRERVAPCPLERRKNRGTQRKGGRSAAGSTQKGGKENIS